MRPLRHLTAVTTLTVFLSAASAATPPTQAEVRYGPHDRNVLDFWQARSDRPVPVLIYFHGGGFVAGHKSLEGLQVQALAKGISAVSANYRFVKPGECSIHDVLLDGTRVVQFVRWKAKEWNIDPERIGLTGGSAGGDMSVWLALHDDLADPKSEDPVKRQSTRVSCVVGMAAQTSNDPLFIAENLGGSRTVHPSVWPMYDISSVAELDKPDVKAMRIECSAINHATKDDPPLYLIYGKAPPEGLYPANAPMGEVIHSAKFGLLLKARLDPLGVPCTVTYPGRRAEQSPVDFLVEHLKGKAP